MRSRAELIKKATKQIYWASRRPRRAKILQVPTYDAPERGTGTMRPIVVPYPMRPLSWEHARECAKAYARVLDGYPKYDREFEAKVREANIRHAEHRQTMKGKPKPERYRRSSGMWWREKFADLVDRRASSKEPQPAAEA